MTPTIEARVKSVLAEQLGLQPKTIEYEQHIYRDLGADSLDAVECVMALEDEFEMDLPDEDWEKCATVGDVIRMFEVKAKR